MLFEFTLSCALVIFQNVGIWGKELFPAKKSNTYGGPGPPDCENLKYQVS
jgi:hypothetical protein